MLPGDLVHHVSVWKGEGEKKKGSHRNAKPVTVPYFVPAIRPAPVGYRILSQEDFKAPPPGVCADDREVGELTLKLKDRW